MPKAARTSTSTRRPAPLPVVERLAPTTPAAVVVGGVDDEPGEESTLGTLLAQFGDEAMSYKVRVDRKDARGERFYLGTVPLTADLLDEIKAKWGGGIFRGRISTEHGAYVRSLTFGIAGAQRDPEATSAAAPSELTELRGIVGALVSSVQALSDAARAPAPQVSSLSQFAEMAKIMRDLTPAPVAAAPATPMLEMFAMMNGFQDMRDRLTEDAEPRDGLASVVDKGLNALTPLLQQKLDNDAKALTTRGRRRIAPLAPSDPVAALAAKIPGAARMYLANQAKRDKEPGLYAEVILDALPDTVYAKLPEMLGRDDFAAALCAAVPQFAPYPAWFAKLADALRVSLLEAAEPVDDVADDATEATA